MELAQPITVYWDLAPCTPLDDSLLCLCDNILECRPLMLQLYDPSPVLGEGARAILERFKGTPVAVYLTLPYSSFTTLAGISIAELGVRELLISIDHLKSVENFQHSPGVGLSVAVNHENWRELPEIVSFCRNSGLKRLVLPMQRLYGNEAPFMLSRDGQLELQKAIAAIGGTAGINLTIHDPFLWRAFYPETPFPQGGCQAANTMIAVSSDGSVFPCPSLPVKLGRIGELTLKEIIASSSKSDFRRKLLEIPSGCCDCAEINVCRGGCRGRALVQHGSLDGIDSACR